MIKAKNWRRRGDDNDSEAGESDKSTIKIAVDKLPKPAPKKEKSKDKAPSAKPGGPNLLSFAEEEDDHGEVREDKSWSSSSRVKKEKQKEFGLGRAASASLLSFGGSEDDGDGKIPKSRNKGGIGTGHGSGHKVGIGKEKTPGTALVSTPSNVQPQAGEYTKERLLELQRNTYRLGGAKPAVEVKPPEPVVVLKGLVKPSGASNGNSTKVVPLSVRDDLPGVPCVDALSDRAHHDGSRKAADDAESRLELLGIGGGVESGGITHIPDAAAIAAAKAKRERLRQAQAAPDYIPIGSRDGGDYRGTTRDLALRKDSEIEAEKKEVVSSDDEAEVQGRLAFLGDDGKRSGGVFEVVGAKQVDIRQLGRRDEEEEEEESRWEEEQLRKGVGKRVEETSNRIGTASGNALQGSMSTGYNSANMSVVPTASWGRALETLSVTQQAESAMTTLQENFQRMQEVYRRTSSDLYRTEENLSASALAITSFEKSISASGEKYIFMQKLRDYIAVLCEFLQTKGPLIEELEEHMQRLHEERANAVLERRGADEADEMFEVEAEVNAAMAVISKGAGTSGAAAAAAAASAAVLSAREAATLAPELDEFGRDVNLQKRLEFRRRAEVRQRRMTKTSAKRRVLSTAANGSSVSDKIEGESSSEESGSEERAYNSGREEVLHTAERIFADASEEFSQLQLVKQKLEGWKQQYASTYNDAYMPLSAPAIFAPYVRLELLKWDPLYSNSGFDKMKWYTLLFDYGMPENGKELDQNDADSDLIPNLVEKVVLPVLHHEIAHCWDRLSTRGTQFAVAAVQEILLYVPATSDSLQELIGAIHALLAEAVSAFQLPTWNLQATNASGQAARLLAQRFGASIRLLKNIALWKDILALPVLEQLALEELLLGKILPHLRIIPPSLHDAVTRTERIIAVLSGVWVGSNFTELSPKLAAFVDYVTILARAVEKKREAGVSTEDTIGIARRIKRMLVELNEYDRARRLAKVFQLKEAL